MLKKMFYGLLFTSLLIGLSTLVFNIQQIKASGTIYIRSNGNFEGTDKINRNGSTYTFTDTIKDSIVVEKSHIVIDGAGNVLEGMANGTGISLSKIENVTIRNMTIKTFQNGISLERCLTCNISGNNITMCFSHGIILMNSSAYNNIVGNNISLNKYYGIYVISSPNNSISGNTIAANSYDGIVLFSSENNSVRGNDMTANNEYGIYLVSSSDNSVSGNNIITNNEYGILLASSSNNSISRNNIADNYGLGLVSSSNNNGVSGNTITDNEVGIVLYSSNNNGVSGNTITANKYDGVFLGSSSDNTMTGNNIRANGYDGIYLDFSSNNSIDRNNVAANNEYGINLYNCSDHNNIFENNITANNNCGIELESSSNNNSVSGNNIGINSVGIRLQESSNNTVYHNNFLNNTDQAYTENSTNFLDGDYPSGGNYWSNYEGEDRNGDGLGDAPYVIDANNIDRYPRIVPVGSIPVFWKDESYYFLITGNMTVSRFASDPDKTLNFKIIGHGYVNITIPREFLDGSFRVFVNNTQTPWLSSWNKTHVSIYFEYPTSGSHIVKIEAEMKLLGDTNSDGKVDIVDIAKVAKNFGKKLIP
jgi:parallel beta-helix repeat protein